MTDYVWYPVTGDGQSPVTAYRWTTGAFDWNTGSWIVGDALIFGNPSIVPGAVPGSGSGNSQGPGQDSVGLVAGEIAASTVAFYNAFVANPSKGDPYIGSNVYSVDLQINSGTVDLDNLLLAGFNVAADISEFPTVDVEGATLLLQGSIVDTFSAVFPNFGTQTASGGGTIDIGSAGTVQVAGSVAPNITVHFDSFSADVLRLGAVSASQSLAFAGTITNFGANNTIDLTSVPFSGSLIDNFDTATNTFSISDGSGTLAVLSIAGTYAPQIFEISDDGAGGTQIITCFAAGTHIRTLRGDVAVEALQVGERVPTLMGTGEAEVRWIGHRRVDCRRHPRPELVWPVRVAAGAFGGGTPGRDLYLSPDHAVFLHGALIPVKYLINGTTIVQQPCDEIVYYHVELPQHDVMLAENLLVESYLDSGDRRAFDNGGAVVEAWPDFSSRVWEAEACAPLVVTGPRLEAARAYLQQAIQSRAA